MRLGGIRPAPLPGGCAVMLSFAGVIGILTPVEFMKEM